ncbi:MAG: DUF2281 domain-containing protein [Truepera sp.]|nr:DUF2281 domain-containing protein [Truepera sp.]
MSVPSRSLAELVEELPPDARAQVRDFVEFLLTKRKRSQGRTLRQNWAGALREHRDRYSSLQLQKKALEWRSS